MGRGWWWAATVTPIVSCRYSWALAYMGVLAFEMVYVKYVLESVPMTTWTRVYYNNALALVFFPPFLLIGSEYSKLGSALLALTVRALPHAPPVFAGGRGPWHVC